MLFSHRTVRSSFLSIEKRAEQVITRGLKCRHTPTMPALLHN